MPPAKWTYPHQDRARSIEYFCICTYAVIFLNLGVLSKHRGTYHDCVIVRYFSREGYRTLYIARELRGLVRLWT